MKRRGTGKQEAEGYLYILPAFIIVFTFGIYPILYSLFVSLHRWRIRRGAFLGLENYRSIFGEGHWALLLLLGIALIVLSLYLRDRSIGRVRHYSTLIAVNRFALLNPRGDRKSVV